MDKMSKSYGNTINMFASKKDLKKQIMSIVTDSTSFRRTKKILITIAKLYALFASIEKAKWDEGKILAGNYGYGHAKTELLNAVLEYFGEARERRKISSRYELYPRCTIWRWKKG